MKTNEKRKSEVVQLFKSEISKLPIGFVLGVAIGGGLFMYCNRKSFRGKHGVLKTLTRSVAPYLILELIEQFINASEKKPKKSAKA